MATSGTEWLSRPEVRKPKQGRYEVGPGIYLTNQYETARKYAKGSKVVMTVELDASKLVPADTVELAYQEVKEFLKFVRLANRKQLVDDLNRLEQRGLKLKANIFVNLLVNNEALIGDSGPMVAKWLSEKGVTVSHETNPNDHNDHWLIVFDPSVILRYKKVDPKSVSSDFQFSLPVPIQGRTV